MLQFLTFPQFAEFSEFNESSAPFRKNSIDDFTVINESVTRFMESVQESLHYMIDCNGIDVLEPLQGDVLNVHCSPHLPDQRSPDTVTATDSASIKVH